MYNLGLYQGIRAAHLSATQYPALFGLGSS